MNSLKSFIQVIDLSSSAIIVSSFVVVADLKSNVSDNIAANIKVQSFFDISILDSLYIL